MAGKAQSTRELVLETALRQFREKGYAATTMRGIASEAGLSAGNAYYYFSGKDQLVQELYVRIQKEHRELAAPRLRQGAPLSENLATVLHTGLDVMTPYHGLGSSMLAPALADRDSISPFSPESAAPRDQAVELMAEAVAASRGTPGGVLGERLPQLLWLAYLGVTLHWVLDPSDGQHRSRMLVDGLAPLLARAIGLAKLPVGRGLAADAVALLDRMTARSNAIGDTNNADDPPEDPRGS
ncbi:TetR/AcrR family transcriptional regulator [Citricoccus sp. GCM10030269]|uniref:TetR/AcrR family transcriptional regulator n=1 Tax=Citricoccus sp. GCM10030269 TaxID=3273388 RepID=UPI0036084372